MATISYLATLQYDAGGGNYTDLGQLTKFTPPKLKFNKSKNSYLGQGNPVHTYAAGWAEPGEVPFTMNMTAAQWTTLLSIIAPGTWPQANRNFRVRYNDGSSATSGSKFAFSGFLMEVGDDEVSRDVDNPIMTSGVIAVSGLMTFTAAT